MPFEGTLIKADTWVQNPEVVSSVGSCCPERLCS
jgi:hypothetical protein